MKEYRGNAFIDTEDGVILINCDEVQPYNDEILKVAESWDSIKAYVEVEDGKLVLIDEADIRPVYMAENPPDSYQSLGLRQADFY